MDERQLAAMEAQATAAVAQYAGLAMDDIPGYCWEAPDDVLALVAEVRRLRKLWAERCSRCEHHRSLHQDGCEVKVCTCQEYVPLVRVARA